MNIRLLYEIHNSRFFSLPPTYFFSLGESNYGKIEALLDCKTVGFALKISKKNR